MAHAARRSLSASRQGDEPRFTLVAAHGGMTCHWSFNVHNGGDREDLWLTAPPYKIVPVRWLIIQRGCASDRRGWDHTFIHPMPHASSVEGAASLGVIPAVFQILLEPLVRGQPPVDVGLFAKSNSSGPAVILTVAQDQRASTLDPGRGSFVPSPSYAATDSPFLGFCQEPKEKGHRQIGAPAEQIRFGKGYFFSRKNAALPAGILSDGTAPIRLTPLGRIMLTPASVYGPVTLSETSTT